MSYQDQEYHRRRSEMELESAVAADDTQSALRHLELARLHHARRQIISHERLKAFAERHSTHVLRADKEA